MTYLLGQLSSFPFIAAKIFMGLDNSEIFGTCTLVCREWNQFLGSNFFWEQLIIAEFGHKKGASFIAKTRDAASKFRTWITKGEAFFRPGMFILDEENSRSTPFVHLPINYNVFQRRFSDRELAALHYRHHIAAACTPATFQNQTFTFLSDSTNSTFLVVNLERLFSQASPTSSETREQMPFVPMMIATNSRTMRGDCLMVVDEAFHICLWMDRYVELLQPSQRKRFMFTMLPPHDSYCSKVKGYLIAGFKGNSWSQVAFRMLTPSYFRRLKAFTEIANFFTDHEVTSTESNEVLTRQMLRNDRKLLSTVFPYTNRTLLELTGGGGYWALVLLDEGADVNQVNKITKTTPLTEAIVANNVTLVVRLIRRGADVNLLVTDDNNFVSNPLYHVVTALKPFLEGDLRSEEKRRKISTRNVIFETLIDARADVNVRVGEINHLKSLLDFATDDDIRDLLIRNGTTPTDQAIYE